MPREQGLLDDWHKAIDRIDRYRLLKRLAGALAIIEPRVTEEQRKNRLKHWNELVDLVDDYIERFLIRSERARQGP